MVKTIMLQGQNLVVVTSEPGGGVFNHVVNGGAEKFEVLLRELGI